MTLHTFYRLALRLPLLVPATVALVVHGLDLSVASAPAGKLVQLLLVSGIYGGIPYALLAVWATFWLGDRTEASIRRMALLAPVFMVAVWLPFAAAIGLLYGRFDTFAGLAALGVVLIVPLGYAYVAAVFLLRGLMMRLAWISA
jgi:hypothetical protein